MSRKKTTAVESLYAGARWQRFYPDTYSRTTQTWQTRVGRRNYEFSTFSNLLGLNTNFDDIHKSDGDSPYLRNVRYMGEKQEIQRAQVTSRNGAELLGIKSYDTIAAPKAEYFVEMWEGRALEIDLPKKDTLLIGGAIEIRNLERASGRLRIFLKKPNEREICDANIPLDEVNNTKYDKRVFRFINPINLKEGATLRFEIEGDMAPDDCGDFEEPHKIRIRTSGSGTHRQADYTRPNTEECMREVAYEWTSEPSIICFEQHTCDEVPMLKGTQVCTDDGQFLVFPIKNSNGITLWRFDIEKREYKEIDTTSAPVDSRSTAVRFAQGLGKLYYVDGYSALQRIDLKTWKAELAIAKQSDIDVEGVTPEDMQAQKGASLIIRIRQRMFLSGFAEDPNFVQYSILNSLTGDPDNPSENAGVQYDQYSDISWFYSPDKSPKDSVCGPITALEQYDDNLIIFRRDGSSVYAIGSEFSAPSQADTFAYNIGVERQEDVCNMNGNLYLYNKSEGFRRFSGAEATFQSAKIDNELRKIPADSPRFMIGHANKVRMYCDLEGRGYADHAFLFMTILAQSSPWYCDDNVPVCWAVGDQTSDTIYAMHANYPAIYIVDSPEKYSDFDSSIDMEYHTPYKSPGSMNGWTLLRRTILRIVASGTNAWYIGLDFDHRDRPAVWRKYIQYQEDEDIPDTAVFDANEQVGTKVVNLMVRAKVRDYQVRIKVSTYDDPAMLMYISSEVGSVRAL